MNKKTLFVCKVIVAFIFGCVMYAMIDAYVSGKPVDIGRHPIQLK